MSDRKAIKKLLKIAKQQQVIIKKLAQQLNPGQVAVDFKHDDKKLEDEHPTPPAEYNPQKAAVNEAKLILNSLSEDHRKLVADLAVVKSDKFSGEVRVKFHQGDPSMLDSVFQTLLKNIKLLQSQNKLPGGSYLLKEVH